MAEETKEPEVKPAPQAPEVVKAAFVLRKKPAKLADLEAALKKQ